MKKTFVYLTLAFIFVTSASAQNRMSDKEVEGLKGKVKVVTTESAALKNQAGNWIEEKKQYNSVVTFDVDGNKIKQDLYNYKGNLSQTSIYSFIDGEKVANQVEHHDETIPLIMAPNLSSNSKNSESSKSRDSRYTIKFKYKYDDKGRRIEDLCYENDGSLRFRDVRIFSARGNEIEWFRYTADGKVSSRTVSVYDAKVNVSEKTWFRSDDSISEKWLYNYEIDSTGNWIKRKSQKWVSRDGKSFFEPYAVTYRQITYF